MKIVSLFCIYYTIIKKKCTCKNVNSYRLQVNVALDFLN